MSVDSDFYARLHAQLPTTSIYAVKVPDGLKVTAPVLAVTRISDSTETDIQGVALYRKARYQVSVYGADLAATRTTRDAVIAALHGYQGGSIKDCQHEDDSESYDIDGVYHLPVDFTVMF